MDAVIQDLRGALRQLRRSPGFAGAAVATLALGIGASTAVFSAGHAVLLRPAPYAEPDQLALLWHRAEATGSSRLRISAPDVAEFRSRSRVFESFAFVAAPRDALLGDPEGPADGARAHVRIGRASPDLFSVLGVRAVVGRTFLPGESLLPPAALAEAAPPPPPGLLLLSHGLWRERFGADSGAVGRTVRIDGAPMRIVGVLPPDFELLLPAEAGIPPKADAWTPLRIPLSRFRRTEGLRDQDSDNTGAVIGRLRAGVGLARAREEMDRIAAGQREEVPFYREAGMAIDVVPMQEDAVSRARPALLALAAAVGLVLLIACLNVASLLLARAAGREGELAVRHALGADRWRLARQLLTEAGLLALLGAAAGLLLATWAMDLLPALAPEGLPRLDDVTLDGTALAYALGSALAATLLAGGVPALLAARAAGRRALRSRDPAASRPVLRRLLVVSQVALCLALLAGTGLLLRSFSGLQRVDPGFRPDGLLTFRVTLPPGSVGGPAERAALMDRLVERVARVPGVESAGLVGGLPLSGEVWRQPYGEEGRPLEAWGGHEADFRVVTSDYFRAMGTRLLAGRFFSAEEDLVEERRVAIVDRRLAERMAHGGGAIGRRLVFPLDGDPVSAEIVGVVETVRHAGLERPGRETIYVPYRQEASREVTVAVRTGASAATGVLNAVRGAAERLASGEGFPVFDFRPMEAYVARALAPNRFALAVFAGLGLVALLLATVGLYGLLSGAVASRAREIGVRMALGAEARDVLRHFLGRGLGLVAAGLALGLLIALASSRMLTALLFEVSPADPLTHLAVAALLAAVAAAAIWVPARRASRLDPAAALRED